MALRHAAGTAMLIVVACALSGCGSDGVIPGGTGDASLMGKIQEYVGDGHGGTKAWPTMIPAPQGDQISRLPYRLDYGLPPKVNRVRRHRVSWYELSPTSAGASPGCPVITLQPTADEDADLFVLEGRGANYWDGADAIDYSTRLPSTGSDGVVGGYVPDWLAFDTGPTGGAPTAQIAVYGVPPDTTYKNYRIESDWAWELTINGASLRQPVGQYSSDWNYFEATSGTQYTVHMTDHDGDPDIYVYRDASTEFVAGDTSTGNASMAFTATRTCRHYIRAYGFAAASNDPEVWVTSP